MAYPLAGIPVTVGGTATTTPVRVGFTNPRTGLATWARKISIKNNGAVVLNVYIPGTDAAGSMGTALTVPANGGTLSLDGALHYIIVQSASSTSGWEAVAYVV